MMASRRASHFALRRESPFGCTLAGATLVGIGQAAVTRPTPRPGGCRAAMKPASSR